MNNFDDITHSLSLTARGGSGSHCAATFECRQSQWKRICAIESNTKETTSETSTRTLLVPLISEFTLCCDDMADEDSEATAVAANALVLRARHFRAMGGAADPLTLKCWSADSSHIVTASDIRCCCSCDPPPPQRLPGTVHAAQWMLFEITEEGRWMRAWSMTAMPPQMLWSDPARTTTFCLTPGGCWLVQLTTAGEVRVRNARTGLLRRAFSLRPSIYPSEAEHHIVGGALLRSAPRRITRDTQYLLDTFSVGGDFVSVATSHNCIRVMDLNTFACRCEFVKFPPSGVTKLAISPNSRLVAAAYSDKTVVVWPLCSRDRVLVGGCKSRQMHLSSGTAAMTWSSHSEWLVTGTQDNVVRLWEVRTGQLAKWIHVADFRISSVAWSPDGFSLAVSGGDDSGKIEIIEAHKEQPPSSNNNTLALACVICLDATREYFAQPCKHLLWCAACKPQAGTRCPICRSEISTVERVFIA